MTRRLVPMILMFLIISLCVSAVEWEEIVWSATVVSDHKTGLPAIIFNIGLAYDEVPDMMELTISWEVFVVEGGMETMLYEHTRTIPRTGAAARIFTASQSVIIEAGKQYGARVWIDDLENDLSHQRSYTYFAPQALPVGLRLVGWDGTEAADLTAMPDEELEELVLIQQSIASYEVMSTEVSISDLFAQHAATDADYPVSVLLLPETGINANWGSQSQPITVTFGLTILVFLIPSMEDVAGFQEQLTQYDQQFIGTVYAGSAGAGLGEGMVVFLHDALRVILDAAVAEMETRSNK